MEALLHFSAAVPLVNSELLELWGQEDAEDVLDRLCRQGLITPQGRGYRLTNAGRAKREELQRSWGLPLEGPDLPQEDKRLTVALYDRLKDKSCQGIWGIAEGRSLFALPLAHRSNPGFEFDGQRLRMTWRDDPFWEELDRQCPRWKGQYQRPCHHRWDLWRQISGRQEPEQWVVDYLLLQFFDHRHYEAMSHPFTDPLNMVNSHKIFHAFDVKTVEEAATFFARLGEAYATQNQVANPGYFDFAEDNVECAAIAVFVSETEAQRLALDELLRPHVAEMTRLIWPLSVGSLSLEELRNPPVVSETYCDWGQEVVHLLMPYEAHPLSQ